MSSVLKRIQATGVVPVISLDAVEQALPLGKALLAGGLPIAEITFRTVYAADAIRKLRTELPQLLVGAGTIITIEDAKQAFDAGAQFIVSPGFDEEIVDFCLANSIDVFPGATDATQIQQALKKGLSIIKFFPAEASGGIATLKALSAPFPSVKFMPTGGISPYNLGSYLQNPAVVACGGSWMVPKTLLNQGAWEEIIALCKAAVHEVHGFTFAHLGINQDNTEEARTTAQALATILRPISEKPNSFFASDSIEIMKEPNRGTHGHIGVIVWDVVRALDYLRQFGFTAWEGSERYDDEGKLNFIYLKPEIGGFALHLMHA